MTAPATARPATARRDRPPPATRAEAPLPAPASAPPPAPPQPQRPAGDVLAALIRVVQAACVKIAGDLGRGDVSPNAVLVRLSADPADVEKLRAYLASQEE